MIRIHPYWTNYSASENGSVYGSRGGRLKPICHHTGYHVMTVRNKDEQKQLRVHRFVWECFNGRIPPDKMINHINGNKQDNRLINLELVTCQENVLHSWKVLGRESLYGEKSPQSKITEDDAKLIIKLCKEEYSNKTIGQMFNLHPNYISLIRHNKRWKHLPR